MKVLIVGLGSIARKHIAALRKIDPDIEIEALRQSRFSKEEKGVRNIFSLPHKPDYDFIIISNPTSLHAATIDRLIDLKIPLFIEKPIFHTLEHEDVVKKAQQHGIINYVACNLRFLDSLIFLHKYLEENPGKRVNEVLSYCGSSLPDWRPGKDYKQSYSADPELGGGVHLDLIHELDYICWLFGFPENSLGVLRNVSSLGIEAFDYANYMLFYPGFTASVILNYYRKDYRRELQIVFEDETWIVDLKENRITDSKEKIIYQGKNGIQESYQCQMEYFVSLIKENRKAENDIVNAYKTLHIALHNIDSDERFKR